jgi:hypothetical protein
MEAWIRKWRISILDGVMVALYKPSLIVTLLAVLAILTLAASIQLGLLAPAHALSPTIPK